LHRLIIVFVGILGLLPAKASWAQSQPDSRLELSGGAGWGSLWDDETLLGRGVPVVGGVGWLIADRVRLSSEVDWLAHSRDAGYLAAEGDEVSVLGRATYLFGAPESRVRPLAGAGVGFMRSTGRFTTRSTVPGANGFPMPGPSVETPWTATRGVFELHAGVRIALHPRAAIRPEFRWGGSLGSGSSTGIEPPFLHLQAIVNLDVLAW
jgi:hypothetical protein